MALSNKFGSLLLTTGNKSEFAVGYSTIYGDMCGGFSILKDVYKSEVFMLSKWRNNIYTELCLNKEKGLIPQNIIFKEPTAETETISVTPNCLSTSIFALKFILDGEIKWPLPCLGKK